MVRRKSAVESVVMDRAFWRGRRVLVTGHTGFKGGWLCLWLQSMGAKVTGYSLAPQSQPSLFEAAGVAQGMTSITGDILDRERLRGVIGEAQPEIVFHMAAQALVRQSYAEPVETYAANVMGTVHLLEGVRQVGGIKAVINITSDKCYENREWPWGYREIDPMGGYDPYSSSKGCAELVTSAYRSSYFNPGRYAEHGVALASVRAGNVIGGGDWAEDRLIPDMVRAIARNEALLIRHPKAIRPWQHVLEPLAGYLLLATKLWDHGPRFAEGWNFGPRDDDARPVSWVADRLAREWGGNARWAVAPGEQLHEAGYLKLDCSKAWSLLGWQPNWDLPTGLSQAVAWYKAHLSGMDMRQFTLAQIAEYETSAGWRQGVSTGN